jgi:hypothetical protein
MAELMIAELVKVIGKNGPTTYNAVFGAGRLEVRPRPGKPGEFDLWQVSPLKPGEPSIDRTKGDLT